MFTWHNFMTLPGRLLLNPLYPTLIYDEQISELKEKSYKKNLNSCTDLLAYSSIIILILILILDPGLILSQSHYHSHHSHSDYHYNSQPQPQYHYHHQLFVLVNVRFLPQFLIC